MATIHQTADSPSHVPAAVVSLTRALAWFVRRPAREETEATTSWISKFTQIAYQAGHESGRRDGYAAGYAAAKADMWGGSA